MHFRLLRHLQNFGMHFSCSIPACAPQNHHQPYTIKIHARQFALIVQTTTKKITVQYIFTRSFNEVEIIDEREREKHEDNSTYNFNRLTVTTVFVSGVGAILTTIAPLRLVDAFPIRTFVLVWFALGCRIKVIVFNCENFSPTTTTTKQN